MLSLDWRGSLCGIKEKKKSFTSLNLTKSFSYSQNVLSFFLHLQIVLADVVFAKPLHFNCWAKFPRVVGKRVQINLGIIYNLSPLWPHRCLQMLAWQITWRRYLLFICSKKPDCVAIHTLLCICYVCILKMGWDASSILLKWRFCIPHLNKPPPPKETKQKTNSQSFTSKLEAGFLFCFPIFTLAEPSLVKMCCTSYAQLYTY